MEEAAIEKAAEMEDAAIEKAAEMEDAAREKAAEMEDAAKNEINVVKEIQYVKPSPTRIVRRPIIINQNLSPQPVQQQTVPVQQQTVPVQQQTVPVQQQTVPVQQQTVLVQKQNKQMAPVQQQTATIKKKKQRSYARKISRTNVNPTGVNSPVAPQPIAMRRPKQNLLAERQQRKYIDDTFHQTKLPQAINNLGKLSGAVDVEVSSPHYHHPHSGSPYSQFDTHLHSYHNHHDHHLSDDHHTYEYHYDQHHSSHAPHHPHQPPEYSYKQSDNCTDSQPPFYKVRTNIET